MAYDMTAYNTFNDIKEFWFGEVTIRKFRSKSMLKAMLSSTYSEIRLMLKDNLTKQRSKLSARKKVSNSSLSVPKWAIMWLMLFLKWLKSWQQSTQKYRESRRLITQWWATSWRKRRSFSCVQGPLPPLLLRKNVVDYHLFITIVATVFNLRKNWFQLKVNN